MCSVIASHSNDLRFNSCRPLNHWDWWHSPVTLLLGDKDMEWLEESNLVTLIVNWIHTDVDFKSGLCYSAGNMVPP